MVSKKRQNEDGKKAEDAKRAQDCSRKSADAHEV